ncbi:hypothetical protein K4F52_005072 [Lecanicillium sp. MT-2017a]|nr:hypothetical protein K4F52_005072 [Lecanicillium sp. MT-2017a]
MKFAPIFTIVGLSAAVAMAAPDLTVRQNGVPDCEDGIDGPDGSWRTANDCKDECYLRENADNDNKKNVCKGLCMNVGHPAPIIVCRGKHFN